MRIKLAENFRAVFYAPFYAAQALGFYAREGVEIELLPSSVPGDAVTALLAGAIDITWGGPMRVMKSHDRDPDSPLVCFCDCVDQSLDQLIVLAISTRRKHARMILKQEEWYSQAFPERAHVAQSMASPEDPRLPSPRARSASTNARQSKL